jgi:hypothetical protein
MMQTEDKPGGKSASASASASASFGFSRVLKSKDARMSHRSGWVADL